MKRPPSDIASTINPDSVLVIDETVTRERSDLRSEEEATLLSLIDGKRTVAEVLHMSRMSGFVAMRRLRGLLERKIVRATGRAPATAEAPAAGAAAPKSPRLGLTQDLSSAAKAFVAKAQLQRTEAAPPPETRDKSPEIRDKPPEVRAKPAVAITQSIEAKAQSIEVKATPVAPKVEPAAPPGAEPARPAEPRVTPLQGSVSLPSVIIAFGPEFLDGRRSPTRRLGSQDLNIVPPPAAPRVSAPAKEPAQSSVLQPPPTTITALTSRQATAIVPRATPKKTRRRTPHSSEEIQAQELWLSVTRRDWQTLAIVSLQNGGLALSVASGLAEAGTLLRGKPVELFIADGGEYGATGEWTWNGRASQPIALPSGGLPPASERFERVVALEPLASNPRGVTIAQAAEAVLMVAETGVTELRFAKRAVEMIGRDRFIGCVMVSRRP
jgi:hypothetical protein